MRNRLWFFGERVLNQLQANARLQRSRQDDARGSVGVSLGQVSDFGTHRKVPGISANHPLESRLKIIVHKVGVVQQWNLVVETIFRRTYDCLSFPVGLMHFNRNPYGWHPASEWRK
jgi:hypothetical protein